MKADYDQAAAYPPEKSAADIGLKGTPDDIRAAYARFANDGEKLKELANAALARDERPAAGFFAYLDAAEKTWTAFDAKDKAESYGWTHLCVPFLSFIEKNGYAADAIEQALAGRNKGLRLFVLNRSLRSAANDGKPLAVRRLVEGGADLAAYDHRALGNAASNNHADIALYLWQQGSDFDAAIRTMGTLNDGAKHAGKARMLRLSLAASSLDPRLVEQAAGANTANGWSDKKPLREAVTAAFLAGNVLPLQVFLRGYMLFKRDNERSRKADEGYNGLAVQALRDIIKPAPDAAAAIACAVDLLPPRDRLNLMGLGLRAFCAENASPLTIDAVIANGADIGEHGNMALATAVAKGHTDLALLLVREHGANIGEAVLDAQLNGGTAETLKKLYTFMASLQAPADQAPRLARLKLQSRPRP